MTLYKDQFESQVSEVQVGEDERRGYWLEMQSKPLNYIRNGKTVAKLTLTIGI